VHLLDGGIEDSPEASLDRLCALAQEAQIYRECVRYYPFVLGAQPVRPIDLAAFYAAIANEGVRPAPYVIDSIERNGLIVYRHDPKSSVTIGSVDRAAFYQLKTMMQGVLARGTARSISGLAPYVAGKTGTSDDENDAWFVGFTNDVTVAVWLGYDNADGKRRTLGGGATGGGVAVPIFEPVIQAVWANVAPKTALAPPSPEAKRQLACKSIDLESGEVQAGGAIGGGKGITECFRIDRNGQVIDTQYNLVSREDADVERESRRGYYSVAPNPNPFGYNGYTDQRQNNGYYYYDNNGRYVPAPRDSRQPGQYYGQSGPYGRDPRVQAPPPRDPYGREYQTPQRIDPGYIWGNRRYY
jgi:penicillin-binding protein 1A